MIRCWKTAAVVVLLSTALLAACSRAELHHSQLFSFGTLVDISLWDASPEQVENAEQIIHAELQTMHSAWHAWQPGPLTATNQQLRTGEWFICPPEVLPLIMQAKQLYRRSNGLFNPAIGQLVSLWGFHSDTLPQGPPPDAAAIAELVARQPGMNAINIDGEKIRSDNPAVELDFGAFAKGYAVDRIIEKLIAAGIKNAIINAGGDLRAIGRHGDRPWRIGIRNPRQAGVLAAIELEGDESVFTSGDYERFYEYEGKRYHHIIDPRTGYPARGVSSVTVIHNNAAEADAAATALFVAGPHDWYKTARNLNIKYVMLVDDKGVIYMNPAMANRVQFETAEQ
ncbi:MAG TPA: FAD:protein FMN transferase, partial [Gammaproteobacteria bacterium]|nr:FAD:protein FMN transferase [Gammaproteobacteria bacterium]